MVLITKGGGAGGGGAAHVIEDEGVPLTARSKLNFVGAGVAVSDGGAGTDDTIVTIDGVGNGSPAYARFLS